MLSESKILVTYSGETRNLSAWAVHLGVSYKVLYSRWKRGLMPGQILAPVLKMPGRKLNKTTVLNPTEKVKEIKWERIEHLVKLGQIYEKKLKYQKIKEASAFRQNNGVSFLKAS